MPKTTATATAKTNPATWSATADIRDDAARGGWARTALAKRVTRAEADAATTAAANAHAAETGHTLGAPMIFPGKTFISCECFSAFAATGRA